MLLIQQETAQYEWETVASLHDPLVAFGVLGRLLTRQPAIYRVFNTEVNNVALPPDTGSLVSFMWLHQTRVPGSRRFGAAFKREDIDRVLAFIDNHYKTISIYAEAA